MKNILFWLLSILSSAPQAQGQTGAPSIHQGFDTLLQRHVSPDGVVNYKGFIADKAALEAYLAVLSEHVPTDSTPRAEAMAYWINAYNAFTIDLVARNYPTASIMRFDNGKTWDVKRIRLGGKKYSLNQIENEILRPIYKDARIHFAVNCAARSCPPLYHRAFTAERLDSLLEERTKAFINQSEYNTIKAGSAQLSKIFEWYAADFGNVRAFVNRYADQKIGSKANITFKEYNWELND